MLALSSPTTTARAGSLADAQQAPTPASAYAREQRILKAYKRQLFAADLDALLLQCFPDKRTAKQLAAAEDRLQYEVPELIEKLTWEEQPAIEALLLAGDFVGCVFAVLKLERTLLQREQPNTAPKDDGHAKAAGLGKISSENYGKLHPGYLFRLPPVKPKPTQPKLRSARRRRAHNPLNDGRQMTLWP
ncbi:hypothetical protein LJ737_20805 [Hymenobacter sp. 15J16-1T3B]|uniref:hypothetical protein n=1 Tax=Hymenobacter sp. 15J16-1T3B TaxID=2886941 RepID=UPI001D10D61F|nr:hypothetical protein [Hymenobacter sp. 15J16-1T3B]MCC3159694.1 hypothetical protein [Hymenobacter sp. 15J16-1T3B]